MAILEYWRDITVGSPLDTIDRWLLDTSDDSIDHITFTIATGSLGVIHPPFGTELYHECQGLDYATYTGKGNNTGLTKTLDVDSPFCCPLSSVDFDVAKTNNTNIVPNGTITITSSAVDINDYEASINGGADWFPAVADEIVFEDLIGDTYTVLIREIAGICSISRSVVITDMVDNPPLIVSEETLPALYAPVFYPITIGFTLDDNTATVKSDVNGTYLEVTSDSMKEYMASLPIVKILESEDYGGTYQITEVDDESDPEKFYFEGVYTSDQAVIFVPFDRQVFQVFAETSIDVFEKIADITTYPQANGEYLLRIEGFLQAVFSVMAPVANGIEITLLKKYYVVPRDFDSSGPATVLNAVYSAIPDLSNYIGSLIPLGPAPINFINEQTQKGLPVLFSYIDTVEGRVKNITSSEQTDIVSSSALVFISALPLNTYTMTWVNPAGVIASLNVTPALPDWITLETSPSDTVLLSIDTGMDTPGGDYDGSDYDGDDYLTGGPNAIVGCYTYEFKDGATTLFTLTICIYPIQKANGICGEIFNIAWVNREGGWSSYPFEGKKVYGKLIDDTPTFKQGNELRRLSVEGAYDTAVVSIFNKAVKDLRFIASLRQSIQAYLWSEETLQWSIPIILDKQSFEVYTVPFKQIQVDDKFTFRYAEEITIQSQ